MTELRVAGLLAASAAACLMAAAPARAQQATPDAGAAKPADDSGGASDSDLAKKLQNPIGDLYSFPFQGNTNFGVGPHGGTQEILNIQPVIPLHISPDWNVITRTILPVVWNPDLSPLPSVPVGCRSDDLLRFPVAGEADQRLAVGSGAGGADPDHQRRQPRL